MFPELASAPYRAVAPLSMLAQRGHQILWANGLQSERRMRELRECDVVYYHKGYSGRALREMRLLARAGVALVWDNDEDLRSLAREPETPLNERRVLEQRSAAGVSAARLAHVTTVASESLAELHRREGASRVHVIETAPATEGWPRRKRPRWKLTVGWAIGLQQERDIRRLPIEQALTRFLASQHRARVVTYGLRLKVRSSRYEHYGMVPPEGLGAALCEFDIGLAPLADTEFNRAQSPVKLREYAAAGVAWLASPVGPNLRLGARQGGQLVGNTEWEEALTALACNPLRRLTLSCAGRRWSKSECLDHSIHLWEDAFHWAVTLARASGEAATKMREQSTAASACAATPTAAI